MNCTVEVLDISNFTMVGTSEVVKKDMFKGSARLKELYTLSEIDVDVLVNGTGIRDGVDVYVGTKGDESTYLTK